MKMIMMGQFRFKCKIIEQDLCLFVGNYRYPHQSNVDGGNGNF